MRSDIQVRAGLVSDAATLGAMIDELDAHYRGVGKTRGLEAAAAMVRRALAEQEGTRFLIAFEGETAQGIACFGVLRPGQLLAGVLFLKDLFVRPGARGRGIGGALMRALAAHAIEHGIGRIDLTTEPSNTGAQRLYERLGGVRLEKVMYRYDHDVLARLAKGRDE